jgi:hypothetical protein
LLASICAHRWFVSSLWLLLLCSVGFCSNALGKLPSGAEQSASETDLPELGRGAGVAVPIL